MKSTVNELGEPLTMTVLEEILSNSQVKAQFFSLGYGIFNMYKRAYDHYGAFQDPTDTTKNRYNDFKEADEDIKYIRRKNGGKALLKYWFNTNRECVDKMLFGDYYKKVRQLEKMLIDNPMLKEFVYNELIVEFLSNISNDALVTKYSFDDLDSERARIMSGYIMALESVYHLYIQKTIH